jgi:hypothetical protein
VLDQAAPGGDEVSATGTLFRLPGGDPDCRIPSAGLDKADQFTDRQAGLARQCSKRLRGAAAGSVFGSVVDHADISSTYSRFTL